MKKILDLFIKYIRKVIMAFFMIYGFNCFMVPFNLIIPINLYTIIFVSFLGIPMLVMFVIIKLLFFF